MTSDEYPNHLQAENQPDREAQPVFAEEPPRLPFPVVGIGASAGGLEAITDFLAGIKPDNPMAFVFVQHLPPTGETMLVEILSRRTSLNVLHVDDGMALKPNHLYVIRPGHTLRIKDGVFHLGQRLATPMNNRPVDDFFKSLAQEQRQRGIGVILSGMGSNGAAGAQAIKAVGGLCVAQDPETAAFPSMPQHLINAGYADYVLRPQDMGDVLLAYASHSYASDPNEPQATLAKRDQQHVREILAVLRTRTHQDFTGYKKPTVLRRIQRRMDLARVAGLSDYAKLLRQNPSEVTSLADDLLIHVTGFFRDPEAWEALRTQVIVPLISTREADGSVRCWVTACSSGEEAYTLAMLLVEEAERVNKPLDIKVFATDMAERTLQNARNGVYPGGIESEIEPQRLERFFSREDAVYRVRPELRERIVFAPQDILQDPPFSRLDVVCCRNLLIYLDPETQKRVQMLLHFSLREGGALFLGSSEMAGVDGLFETLDKKTRIYRRLGPTRHGAIEFPSPHVVGGSRWAERVIATPETRLSVLRPSISQMSSRALLEQHTPAAVTIDRERRIVFYHGNTEPFIASPRGEPTRDLMDLVRENVRGAVRTAVHQAAAGAKTVTIPDGWIEIEPGRRVQIGVTVSPLDPKNAADYLVVSFHERGGYAPVDAGRTDPHETDGMAEDLRRTREELQSTIEELQTSNEELKASHEEVVSVNEELQSSNEELETSREEMQSLNEELSTVNSQLHAKIEEHLAARNDLASLLTSTNIAVLFLDTHFCIRRFTPQVRDLFEMRDSDLGRPLSDLAKKFVDQNLAADAEKVLITLVPIEREVTGEQGHSYLRRTTPYRTADNRIDGIVISFVDITARLNAEAAAKTSEQRLRLLVNGAKDLAMIMLDPEGQITMWNDGAERLVGYTESEAIGLKGDVIFTPEDRSLAAPQRELAQAVAAGRADDKRWHLRKDGTRFWGSGSMNLIPAADGTVAGFVKIFHDETAAREIEERLRASKSIAEQANHAKDEFLAVLSHELRTPLSTILLWAKLLYEQAAQGSQTELADGLAVIKRSADAQKDLIEDLLDVSRIATGQLRLNMELIDLTPLVRDACDSIAPTTVAKGVNFLVLIPEIPIMVSADPNRLRQVLWNLLSNAVKFTPAGEHVRVEMRPTDDSVEIVVRDTGSGIAPDFLPFVFERFRQAEPSSTRRYGGMGLGLSIVKQLVELHGGSVAVESGGAGHGSTFTIHLPLSRQGDTATALSPAATQANRRSRLAGRNVLVVEDDEPIRTALTINLQAAGLAVVAVGTVIDAWEHLTKGKPDLLVSDIGLPGEDGYALITRLRQHEQHHGLLPTPAIALTAYAGVNDRDRSLQQGFQRHLCKPVDVDGLIDLIAELLAMPRKS